MAVVFLGYQKSLDRQIAIKVLLPILAYDPEIVLRFQREAKTQGKLDHPSIISVYEVYDEGGLTFFTMPYVSGRSLRTYLEDEPKPPIEKVRRYLGQAADALAYAHRRGVIHRDVKPDNILIDEERDWVILTDFGIAKALSAESTLTTPGDLLGTPHYMSPEQGEGKLDLDGRADQYSLGLIGYEMLAGRRPFKADNLAELMYMHRFEEPESLDKLCPDVPQGLRDTIKRAISKDREDRFPTMEGFYAALEATEYELVEEDRTEPMPPPGSEDTTLRIPTPPGRQPATPQPVPVDETAPETTEPPSAPEPWAVPEPAKARTDPDTPPPWTPTPAVAPWAAPPVSEPSTTPEPAVGGPDKTETVGVGAVGVAAVAERPRGVPRSLLIGGGAAAVLLVGALFLFGPLRPVAPDRATRPTEGESVAEAVPSPEQAEPAGEPGVAEREPTPAGPGEEVQVAGAEVGQPGPTTGREEAAGEGAVEETPAAEPAEEPPAEEIPEEGGDRTRAEQARQRVEELQDAAAAVVTDEADLATLQRLDARLAVAGDLLAARRFDEADRAFSDLASEYEDLATAARDRVAARESEIARQRVAAEQARNDALGQRQAAIEAGAERYLRGQLTRLDDMREGAQQALDESRFSMAQSLFEGLTRGYRDLARAANSERARREAQSQAVSAQSAMQHGREAALAAGAEARASDRLAEADAVRDRAQTEFRNQSYAEALARFQEAERAYTRLAEDLAAQPVEEEQPAEAEPPAEEVVPPEEAAATSEQAAIEDLIRRFSQAFQAEDLELVAAEVYKGEVPQGNNTRDARFLQQLFRVAEELSATYRIESLEVATPAAVAEVRFDMRFRQARTGETREMGLRLRLRFASGPDGWRLERLERR
jgi:serine/threonine protein kinase/ketosteroid isomerase-like protein